MTTTPEEYEFLILSIFAFMIKTVNTFLSPSATRKHKKLCTHAFFAVALLCFCPCCGAWLGLTRIAASPVCLPRLRVEARPGAKARSFSSLYGFCSGSVLVDVFCFFFHGGAKRRPQAALLVFAPPSWPAFQRCPRRPGSASKPLFSRMDLLSVFLAVVLSDGKSNALTRVRLERPR